MAQIGHYDVGDLWTPQATFTVSGTPTDPTTLLVRLQNAAGVESEIANVANPSALGTSSSPVARPSVGVFRLNPGVSLDAAGYWFVKFTGTGTAAAAETHQAIVDPDDFVSDGGLSTRALVGLAETKDWLQQMQLSTAEDLDLVRVINDISDRMHFESGREFKVSGSNPQTRTFVADPRGLSDPWYVDGEYLGERSTARRKIDVGDLTSFTQVQIIDDDWSTVLETVATSDITAHPTVRQTWEPIRSLEFQTDVTRLAPGMRIAVAGTWGFPAVPGNVRQAVLDAVASIYDRDVTHWRQDLAPVAQTQEGGTVVMVGGSQRLLSLPPSAVAVAWSYRDNWLG
jgi:hypothetical protein